MNIFSLRKFYYQNPKLKEIGSFKKYKRYLKKIFKNSKLKKIVYHHSDEKIEQFKDNFIEGYAARHGVSKKAIFFLKKPIKKEFLTKRPHLIFCILNTKNPFYYKTKFKTGTKEAKAHPGIKEGIDYALEKKHDSVIFDKIWDNKTWCEVITVFSPKQIHILGSKKDIRGFKKFNQQL
jgi:hypothetical protein